MLCRVANQNTHTARLTTVRERTTASVAQQTQSPTAFAQSGNLT
jgi:hypothetical protein